MTDLEGQIFDAERNGTAPSAADRDDASNVIDFDREAIKLAKESIEIVQLDPGSQSAAIVIALLAIEARLAWLGQIINNK